MREYILDDKYIFYGRKVSEGAQKKYKKGGYYYKVNNVGNEGFTEYLVTRLLKNSTLGDKAFVDYEYCKINGRLGCRTRDFLLPGEEYISIDALHTRLFGNIDLSNHLLYLRNAKDRLNYILGIVESIGFPRDRYYRYLNTIVQLDMLISNTDRHTHNYGLIYNKNINSFRLPPIFDNGMSLDIDGSGSRTSCMLSGSFEDQVGTFSYPVEPCFKINYKKVYEDLKRIEKLYGSHREVGVLRDNLGEYDYIFKL